MGSGNNSAQRAAERRERETEARIAANVGRINTIYDDPARGLQIQQATDAVRGMYREELDRVQAENGRQVTFAMARSGNAGGSLETETRSDLGKSYQRGLIESERGAQGFAADLRSADEQSRAQMVALAQGGGDIGTASARAGESLRNNLAAQQAGVNVRDIGQAFDSLGDVFERSRQQREYRRGVGDGIGSFYTPGFGYGGGN